MRFVRPVHAAECGLVPVSVDVTKHSCEQHESAFNGKDASVKAGAYL